MALLTSIAGYGKSGGIEIREEVVGLDKALAALEAFGDGAQRELISALYREAQSILTDSREEVPVDTGALRSSGHAERLHDGALAGYGGTATPYALRQHEELNYRHTVGKAKYLEDPYKRHASDMDDRIARELLQLAWHRWGWD